MTDIKTFEQFATEEVIREFNKPGEFEYDNSSGRAIIRATSGDFSASAKIRAETLSQLAERPNTAMGLRDLELRFFDQTFSGEGELFFESTGQLEFSMKGVGRGVSRVAAKLDRADLAFTDKRTNRPIPTKVTAQHRSA